MFNLECEGLRRPLRRSHQGTASWLNLLKQSTELYLPDALIERFEGTLDQDLFALGQALAQEWVRAALDAGVSGILLSPFDMNFAQYVELARFVRQSTLSAGFIGDRFARRLAEGAICKVNLTSHQAYFTFCAGDFGTSMTKGASMTKQGILLLAADCTERTGPWAGWLA